MDIIKLVTNSFVPICVSCDTKSTINSIIDEFKNLNDRNILHVCGACEITNGKKFIPVINEFCFNPSIDLQPKILISDFTDGIQDVTQDAYLRICENVQSYNKVLIFVNDEYDLSEALRSRLRVVRIVGEFVISNNFLRLSEFIVNEFDKAKFYGVPKIVVDIPVGMSFDKKQLIESMKIAAHNLRDSGKLEEAIKVYSFISRLYTDLYTKTELLWGDFVIQM